MSAKLALFTGATLLTLVFGSVGGVAALPDGSATENLARRGARVYGVVETVEDETLVLATPVGPVTLVTDANTRFRIPDVEEAGLDDLAIGDTLAANGWWEKEGSTFHAFGVAQLKADRAFPLAGKLDEVGEDTLAVETGRGVATVYVDGETGYHVPDVEQPSLDDLEEGMRVIVKGTLRPDGSMLAQMVAVPHVGPRQGRLQGEVLAVEGDTFTLHTASGRRSGRQLTVQTDETTEFRVPEVEHPSIADLEVGDRVAGEGHVGEDGSVHASLVMVLPEDVARLSGEAAAIEGTTLALDTLGGRVNVLTDSDTVVRIPGVEDPVLDDIEVGSQVTAAGIWDDEATFHAIAVGVHGGRRAGQPGVLRGRVISVETDSLLLGTQHGPVTVVVNGETRYRVPGVDNAGIEDLEAGAAVGARGTWNENGTLQAAGVAVLRGDNP